MLQLTDTDLAHVSKRGAENVKTKVIRDAKVEAKIQKTQFSSKRLIFDEFGIMRVASVAHEEIKRKVDIEKRKRYSCCRLQNKWLPSIQTKL